MLIVVVIRIMVGRGLREENAKDRGPVEVDDSYVAKENHAIVENVLVK